MLIDLTEPTRHLLKKLEESEKQVDGCVFLFLNQSPILLICNEYWSMLSRLYLRVTCKTPCLQIVNGRICGDLAVARAFGDSRFKTKKNESVPSFFYLNRRLNPQQYIQHWITLYHSLCTDVDNCLC